VRERLFGSPREVRLPQTAVEVLALIAYRQPIGKEELDSLRGADAGPALRQLQRLGLVTVARRADPENREVLFGTTPRFLEIYRLTSLDDLPRTGDWERL
jgi:segregation and condensation protein B